MIFGAKVSTDLVSFKPNLYLCWSVLLIRVLTIINHVFHDVFLLCINETPFAYIFSFYYGTVILMFKTAKYNNKPSEKTKSYSGMHTIMSMFYLTLIKAVTVTVTAGYCTNLSVVYVFSFRLNFTVPAAAIPAREREICLTVHPFQILQSL